MKLRVVLADDLLEAKIDPMIGAICDWLAASASNEARLQHADGLEDRVEQRTKAIREHLDLAWTTSYEEAIQLLNGHFDIAIIDHRWTEHVNPDAAGSELLDRMRSQCPGAALFQYTALYDEIAPIVEQATIAYGAKTVPKRDLAGFVRDRFIPALQNAARARLRNLSANDQSKLREACLEHESLDAFLDIPVGDGRLRELAVGWLTPTGYPNDLPEIFSDILKEDLTYAASLYFGVGPIKQITHGIQWHFKVASASELLKAADQRWNDLQNALSNVQVVIGSDRMQLYRQLLSDYFVEYKRYCDTLTPPTYFSRKIADARDVLRFGTSIPKNVLHTSCIKNGRKHFEIFVPVHLLFADEINTVREQFKGSHSPTGEVLEECYLEACFRRDIDLPEIVAHTSDPQMWPCLAYNYWLFRFTYRKPISWKPDMLKTAEGFPKAFTQLGQAGFEHFGRATLIFKENGKIRIIDITAGDHRLVSDMPESEFLPRRCACASDRCFIGRTYLEDLAENQMLVALLFQSWRQV